VTNDSTGRSPGPDLPTCLVIAHDLSIIKHISDRAAVMYPGKIVQTAPIETLHGKSGHPPTWVLGLYHRLWDFLA
jgi:ABC-type dipeptide/oligopeptide/nickel transport system ATPase component